MCKTCRPISVNKEGPLEKGPVQCLMVFKSKLKTYYLHGREKKVIFGLLILLFDKSSCTIYLFASQSCYINATVHSRRQGKGSDRISF